ncbi:MAG: hypothetical protein RLZZ450_6930 [Pseudomonadota bacterium]|jgi:cytochrome c peroxidase
MQKKAPTPTTKWARCALLPIFVWSCVPERSTPTPPVRDDAAPRETSMEYDATPQQVDAARLLAPDAAPPSLREAGTFDARVSLATDAALGAPTRIARDAFAVVYAPPPHPVGNVYTDAKALLGKALFWDEQLSADGSVACGTCHTPEAGGSDPRPARAGFTGHPGADSKIGTSDDPHGSPGIRRCRQLPDGGLVYVVSPVFAEQQQVTRRRSMSVADAAFWSSLFWDGRSADMLIDPISQAVAMKSGAALEVQALLPLLNVEEMACEGTDWAMFTARLAHRKPLALAHDLPSDLLAFVSAESDYAALFELVFGTKEITPVQIAQAIATYERTLVSDRTAWDRWRAGDDSALSDQQLHGLTLFATRAGCACCHAPPVFGVMAFANEGFTETSWDRGREEVTAAPTQRGAFRAVSLRNVGLREPGGLLHDGIGAGADLPTLLAAYNREPLVPSSIGLCVRHGVNLSQQELDAIVAFLRTGLTDPRAAAGLPPFDHPALSAPM